MSPTKNKSATQRLVQIAFAAVLFTAVLDGCSTVHVRANQAPIADDIHSTTVVALWWGVSDPLESVECGEGGLKLVSVSTSWVYSLCAVVTLGAVVPMDLEYRCTSNALSGGGDLGDTP